MNDGAARRQRVLLVMSPKRKRLVELARRFKHLNRRRSQWSVWTPEKQQYEFEEEEAFYARPV
jgi:hypothetical protein